MDNFKNIKWENTGWSFPIGVDSKTGKIKMNSLKDDIKLSVIMILKTIIGERLVHPEYGSGLNRFMFEPINYDLVKSIRDETLRAILRWENRIYSVDVNVYNDSEDDNKLIITVKYIIPVLKEIDSVDYVFDVFMNE